MFRPPFRKPALWFTSSQTPGVSQYQANSIGTLSNDPTPYDVEELKNTVEAAVTEKKEEVKAELPPPLPQSPPPTEVPPPTPTPVEEKKEEPKKEEVAVPEPAVAAPVAEESTPVPPTPETTPVEVVGGGGESLAELETPAVPAPVTNGLNGKHTPGEDDVEDLKDEIISSVTDKLESLKVSLDAPEPLISENNHGALSTDISNEISNDTSTDVAVSDN
ncbi:hypothetical protein M8J75_001209 [Diaphorina citri]|nr:hypothetical protein M8J75_001209 [Diaphorina citri]